MNNSKLAIESVSFELEQPIDSSRLRERESELLQIIDALVKVQKLKEWGTLKTYVFDGRTESLQKQLLAEAKKLPADTQKLAKLTGELKWAERFSDLLSLESEFREELQAIRLQLHGTTQKT